MFRFSNLISFILGISLGFSICMTFQPKEEERNLDPNHMSNYVWTNLVEVPDRTAGVSWFQQEYDVLEMSWQKMVRKYDHMQLPDDMAADVLTFNYIPWVQELRGEVEKRDEPYKNLKLEILDLRLKSLTYLESYYTDYKEEDFDKYIEYDSQFREITDNHPEIFDKEENT